jgi:dihydrofolate reductase
LIKNRISIIVAMSPNWVIGKKGEMPWYLPGDLKNFARLTSGHPVIMGRKTYESIVERIGHPLKNRTNIIITSKKDYDAPNGCIIASSINDAVDKSLTTKGSEEIFIIGGSRVYKSAINYTSRIYLTLVFYEGSGDTYFPKCDFGGDWHFVRKLDIAKEEKDEYDYKVVIYENNSTNNRHINPAHSRSDFQNAVMKKIKEDGVCPFCPENFSKYHTKPIIKDCNWWVITENFAPYDGTFLHLLIVYKKHATTLSEIDEQAFNELLKLVSWSEKHYKIEGGAFFMRFGKTDHTCGTVEHLHAQLIAGNSSLNNEGEKLKVSLGYKKPK